MNQEDIQTLIDNNLAMAERLLLKQNEFFPIGAHIDHEGEFAFVGLHDGDDFPLSTALIGQFKEQFEAQLSSNEIRAYAITYDTRVTTSIFPNKVDAITMLVKHQNGHAVSYYFPYKLNNNEIEYFESWGEKAD